MTRLRFTERLAVVVLATVVAGCGEKKAAADEHGHAPGADESAAAPVAFKEGQGLQLAPETANALGVKTAEVEERKLAHAFTVTASVFDAGPPARATTLLPSEIAAELERHPPPEAKILSVRREIAPALNQAEIVLAVPGAPAIGTTLELTLHGPEHTVPAVPRAAVLRTATGTFVYVVNGGRLLRTPVKTGTSDGTFVEITDGLYAGDVVVSAGVEHLWLTELRLTKGGGHSH